MTHPDNCQCRLCIRAAVSAGRLGGLPYDSPDLAALRSKTLQPGGTPLDVPAHIAVHIAPIPDSATGVSVVPKVLTSLYLEPAAWQELKRASAASGVPMAALVREAVSQYLERRRNGKRTTVRSKPGASKKSQPAT